LQTILHAAVRDPLARFALADAEHPYLTHQKVTFPWSLLTPPKRAFLSTEELFGSYETPSPPNRVNFTPAHLPLVLQKLSSFASYAGSLIMDTISSVKNTPINSKSEDTFFIEAHH